MKTENEIIKEEKINIYLFEYEKLTKKINSNIIYLNDCKNDKVMNFDQLELNIKETNNIYFEFQRVIKKKIIQLTK